MKNMYLAAAMVVSLAFSACSDEESGKADRAYKPIEIYGNINEVVNNVQETRAVGAAWGSDDRIGVTVDAVIELAPRTLMVIPPPGAPSLFIT